MVSKREPQITPAAVGAALAGDMDNMLVAVTPGGIEAQEKCGQQALTSVKDRLPIHGTKMDHYGRADDPEKLKQWEAVGFKFGKAVDDLFIEVEMPPGWKLEPTDHSMWSNLVDDQGRKRAMVFYKAAFYDRKAHTFGLEPRYIVESEYEPGPGGRVRFTIMDRGIRGGRVVVASEWFGARDYSEQDKASAKLRDKLDADYPSNKNPLAYWNDPA